MSEGCTRSHPHELMDCCCEHKTHIARLSNENAHLLARAEAAEAQAKLSAMENSGLLKRLADNETELSALQDVDAMVSRFLCWKLPKDFAPDGRIKFDREFLVFDGFDGAKPADISEMPAHFWPTGTNLLTAEQAKAMIMHMLGIEHG